MSASSGVKARDKTGETFTLTPAGKDPLAFTLNLSGGTADGPNHHAAAGPTLPFTLGGYELLQVLGRGGMGIVYKARQLALNRLVALKMVLGGAYASSDSLARFRHEAEAAAHLDHSNIVPVYEVGVQDGQHFFSMKYIEGQSLAEFLHHFRGKARLAATVMETVARAVHHAHQHGILHRDLKPSNILLDGQGQPHITDFGLAKRVEDEGGSLTATGILVGTPRYMAPEQARTEKSLTTAVDVWGLGVVFYELLVGQPAFKAENELDTLLEVLEREPRRPGSIDPRIDRDLETICLKCLEKNPKDRYPSAEAFADDLSRWLRGDTIKARPASPPERAWRWAKRRPAIAALLAAVLLTFVGGSSGIAVAWLHALAGWRTAETNENKANEARELAETRKEDAEATVYFSRIAQADLERRLNNPISARNLLARCEPEYEGAVDRRGWEWRHLQGVLNADLLTIDEVHDGVTSSVAFTPDGERLVSAGGSPYRPLPPDRVRVWQAFGASAGTELRSIPTPQFVHQMVLTPDGARVVYTCNDRTLNVADLATGQVVMSHEIIRNGRDYGLSPDGSRYAAVTEGKLIVWDVASGKEVRTLTEEKLEVWAYAFSLDGKQVAYLTRNGLSWWDIDNGKELGRISVPDASRAKPRFSPDGKWLAFGVNGGARVWDLTTDQLVQNLSGHTGHVLAVAFSPDGKQLATAGADATVRLWSIAAGNELLLLRGHQGRVTCLDFHPSGKFLASGSAQPADVKIWDLTRNQEYLVIPTFEIAPNRVEGMGYSADGKVLRLQVASGTLRSVDAATGEEIAQQIVDFTPKWTAPTALVAFSRDGRWLATVAREVPSARDDRRRVRLTDLNAPGEPGRLLEHRFEALHLAFSQDGSRLAVSAVARNAEAPREVVVWDTATGQQVTVIGGLTASGSNSFGCVALSADGRLLAYSQHLPKESGSKDSKAFCAVRLRDLATGEDTPLIERIRGKVDRLAFNADGRMLAVATEDIVRIYDRQRNDWLHSSPLPGSQAESIHDLAFSPDGQRLTGVSRVNLVVWDVKSGQMVLVLRGAPPRTSDNGFNPKLAWSPDGKQLAASSWNHSVAIWDSSERGTPAAKAAAHQAALKRHATP